MSLSRGRGVVGVVGGGDLRACSGGESWFSCGMFGSFSGGSNDGCLKGCSLGHSSVERSIHEIPRWTVPRTRQRLGSPVECSLSYISCWSRWVDRFFRDDHIILLVGELGCGNIHDRRSCQGKSTVVGQFGS